ncbi:helix-turn-helix domain-containing protein [Burkholderia cenocepacia]|uniref:helix-turn-helix domain-containing protein n=1 Tax=Burkholderia cenocepacia TaxID=95486 RepID=UPI000760D971|nr:helix-turn-helix transcriptional regulator [Burkholderia cenocepacia]KWU26292.1 hypothetical protein AS149_25205 [Burkholderia cenocepacia]
MQNFPTLHEQLDSLRRLRKLTLAAIGERMSVGKEQVSRLCSGARDAKVSSMQSAAESVQGVWVLVPEESYDSVRKVLDKSASRRRGSASAPATATQAGAQTAK